MARELPRTLRSLSPSMQRGVGRDDYEVIVVDNGSRVPWDRESCADLGLRLTVIDVPDATPSPSAAVNLGIAAAQGELVGVMIDGARMASPGLLSLALTAHRLHERAVIASVAFHLGHEVQMVSVHHGYDQETEDALLEGVGWEEDGYRLFDIAVFAGSSAGGWFKTPHESNALFLGRSLWEELGGFDEAFTSPGGGLVNLDVLARACRLPNSQLVQMLGEATFHQVHGGVATNALVSPGAAFGEEYERLRGEPFVPPQAEALFVGTVPRHAIPSFAASLVV